MLTIIYFIRHAESDLSVREDSIRPLICDGLQDAVKLSLDFKSISINAIYSSPYFRVLQTVNCIAKDKNLSINESIDLRERKIGAWLVDFNDYAKKQWGDFGFKLDTGECLKDIQDRNIRVLQLILEKHEGQNIIIGTHGTALSCIINYFDKSFGYQQFLEIVDLMPLVVKMEFKGSRLQNYTVL